MLNFGLNEKLRDAVLKGINEAFDINDMGHDIDQTPS